jgi:hypothetical protein
MLKYQTTRAWGTMAPDKGYDLGHVDVRFDVPLGVSYELMEVIAQPEIQKAIDQFEKIGKWQFYDKIQPQYHVSMIHSAALGPANMLLQDPKNIFTGNKSGAQAVGDVLGTDVVTMVARVYFVRPLVWVNDDEVREYKEGYINYENGFVPLKDMPEYVAAKAAEGTSDDIPADD